MLLHVKVARLLYATEQSTVLSVCGKIARARQKKLSCIISFAKPKFYRQLKIGEISIFKRIELIHGLWRS